MVTGTTVSPNCWSSSSSCPDARRCHSNSSTADFVVQDTRAQQEHHNTQCEWVRVSTTRTTTTKITTTTQQAYQRVYETVTRKIHQEGYWMHHHDAAVLDSHVVTWGRSTFVVPSDRSRVAAAAWKNSADCRHAAAVAAGSQTVAVAVPTCDMLAFAA